MTSKEKITWEAWQEEDKLGIKKKVEGLYNILQNETKNTVYSVTAPFGVGKTFFCEGLESLLKNRNQKVFYYNAWKCDFYDSPSIPLLVEFSNYIKNLYPDRKDESKVKSIARAVGSMVVGVASAVQVSAPVLNVSLDLEKCAVKTKEVYNADTLRDIEKTINSISNEYNELVNSIETFKSEIKTLLKNDKLVVIIDELDRCRPDFAIKTLEFIKHLFDIDNIIFVIAFDNEQLKNSVKQLYGTTNYDGYIRKFIDCNFTLPSPEPEKYLDFLYDQKMKKYENKFNFLNDGITQERKEKILKNHILSSFYFFEFSLRKLNQVIDRLNLFIKAWGKKKLYIEFATWLCCIYEFDKSFFSYITGNPCHFNDLGDLNNFLVKKGFFERDSKFLNKSVPLFNETFMMYFQNFGVHKKSSVNAIGVFLEALKETTEISSDTYAHILAPNELYLNQDNSIKNYFDKIDFVEMFNVSEEETD